MFWLYFCIILVSPPSPDPWPFPCFYQAKDKLVLKVPCRLLIIIKMNRNNTLHHKGRTTTHQNERTANHNNHNSLSKHSNLKQTTNEKISDMISRIMSEVNRLHKNMQFRIITKEMLREGGSKLFYDVFAILAKATIDDNFEPNQLSHQGISSMLRVFNYSGNLNKNIFQPIGAPHTWIHCLAILDFMAEMARYSSSFRAHVEETNESDIEGDQNYFLRKAVLDRNPQVITEVLERQIEIFEKGIQSQQIEANGIERTIENMNIQQRSLDELQKEIQAELKKHNNSEAQVLNLNVEKGKIEATLAKKNKEIIKLETEKIELETQISTLEYKLSHTELTLEEQQKCAEEVRMLTNEKGLLEREVEEGKMRIDQKMKKHLHQLKESYTRTNFLFNEINSTTLDGYQMGPKVPFVDNFDELHHICNRFLDSGQAGQTEQFNLRSEFQRIAKQWEVAGHSYKAGKVVESVRQKLEERQKSLEMLTYQVEAITTQEGYIVDQIETMITYQHTLKEQLTKLRLEIQDREIKIDRMEGEIAKKVEEIHEMNEKRAQTQRKLEEKIKFVELIKKTHADSVTYMRSQIKKMKEIAEMVKRGYVQKLQKFKDKLNELYANDGINKEVDEIIEKFKNNHPNFIPDGYE